MPTTVNISAATFVPGISGGVKRGLVSKVSESISVKDYGATGDGTTNDAAALVAADTAAVAAGYALLLPPGIYYCNTNSTLASDLIFAKGGLLEIDTGVTLALGGSITAGRYQIFTGTGVLCLDNDKSFTCAITATNKVNRLYPEWFKASGATTDTLSWQAMRCFVRRYSTVAVPITIDLDGSRTYSVPDPTAGKRPTHFYPNVIWEGNGCSFDGVGVFGSAEESVAKSHNRFSFSWGSTSSTAALDPDLYLISSAVSGATTVTLTTSGSAPDFDGCTHVLVSGFDHQQANSYPANPHFFEFVPYVSRASAVLTLGRALTNAYSSTWPENSAVALDWGRARAIPIVLARRVEVKSIEFIDSTYGDGKAYILEAEHALFTDCSAVQMFTTGSINSKLTRCRTSGLVDFDKMNHSVECHQCWFDNMAECTGVNRLLLQDCTIKGSLSVGPRQLIVDGGYVGLYTPNRFPYSERVEFRGGAVISNYVNHGTVQSYTLGGAGEYANGVLTKTSAYSSSGFLSFLHRCPPGAYVYVTTDTSVMGRVLSVTESAGTGTVVISFAWNREPANTAVIAAYNCGELRFQQCGPSRTVDSGGNDWDGIPYPSNYVAKLYVDHEVGPRGSFNEGGLTRVVSDPQQVTYFFTGDLNPRTCEFYCPAGEVVEIVVDVVKAYGTATTALLQLACTGGAFSYAALANIDLKTVGQRRIVPGRGFFGKQSGDTDTTTNVGTGFFSFVFGDWTWPEPTRTAAQTGLWSLTIRVRNPMTAVAPPVNTALMPLIGSATYDAASLVDAAGATTTVTVTGAAVGDFAQVSHGVSVAGITVTPWVSAADTVSVRFQNESGGTLDLASGTLRAVVTPKAAYGF